MRRSHNEALIHDMIQDFFQANPTPDDTQIHEFAESLGLSSAELEKHIFEMFGQRQNLSTLATFVTRTRNERLARRLLIHWIR